MSTHNHIYMQSNLFTNFRRGGQKGQNIVLIIIIIAMIVDIFLNLKSGVTQGLNQKVQIAFSIVVALFCILLLL